MASGTALPPEAFASVELFLGLSPAALAEVSAPARVRHVPKETRIFDQDDAADRAYALVEGGVRIVQSGSDGAQTVMRFIGPGGTFGTAALFTDRRYPAEALTVADSLEVSWTEAELLDLMARHATIGMNVIRIVGQRLQEAQERVRELSTQTVERRVAHAVLRLAGRAGQGTPGGLAIGFPLRRKDLAAMSGTTLHTASRILAAWQKAGLLISSHQRLTVRKPSELLRIAEHSVD